MIIRSGVGQIALGVGVLLLGLAASVLAWNRIVESVIFQPSRGPALDPGRLGVTAEEVFLDAADGVRVHAWWLPAVGATRAILFLHGNAGNASHRLPNAAALAGLGASVLLLDYRGYGRSEGRATEAGVYLDARAGLDHLREERGLPEDRIIVFGRSLGGAVAVDLARDHPGLAGVILESTFTSVADVASAIGGGPLAFLAGERFASDRKIGQVRAPLLFFHGDRDRVIPWALGRRLYELASRSTHASRDFETLEGAGHNDTARVGGRASLLRIRDFFDEVAPGSP